MNITRNQAFVVRKSQKLQGNANTTNKTSKGLSQKWQAFLGEGESMTEQERKRMADELDLKLADIKDMDKLLEFLCREYARAEYIYNQKVFANVPKEACEPFLAEVELIRERITNITMYKNGWCYAHEGGGWYELDYEQGPGAIWY